MPALALRRGSLLLTAISLSHSISLYLSLSLSRGASRLLSKSSNTAWRASVDIKQLRPLRLVMPRPSAECSVMHACFLTDGAHAHMHNSTQTCRTLPISGLDPISTNKLRADGGFSCTSFIFFGPGPLQGHSEICGPWGQRWRSGPGRCERRDGRALPLSSCAVAVIKGLQKNVPGGDDALIVKCQQMLHLPLESLTFLNVFFTIWSLSFKGGFNDLVFIHYVSVDQFCFMSDRRNLN